MERSGNVRALGCGEALRIVIGGQEMVDEIGTDALAERTQCRQLGPVPGRSVHCGEKTQHLRDRRRVERFGLTGTEPYLA